MIITSPTPPPYPAVFLLLQTKKISQNRLDMGWRAVSEKFDLLEARTDTSRREREGYRVCTSPVEPGRRSGGKLPIEEPHAGILDEWFERRYYAVSVE